MPTNFSKPVPISGEIKDFYDDFAGRVLFRDFQRLNVRQQAVIGLCKQFIPRKATVLEVGCGLGIITKSISKCASYFLAIDISPEHIRIARRSVAQPHVELAVADILQANLPLASVQKFDV